MNRIEAYINKKRIFFKLKTIKNWYLYMMWNTILSLNKFYFDKNLIIGLIFFSNI